MSEHTSPSRRPVRLLVDDDWVEGGGERVAVVNPSDGSQITTLALADAQDVDRAVRAARHAFDQGPWPRMKPKDRARILWRVAELIDAHAEELGALESLDTGKPLHVAQHIELAAAAEAFRYYAGWTTKLSGHTKNVSLPGEWVAMTLREPIGVVGLIVPWNSPLLMAATKLAPALAAGCTTILKPAELTPLSAERLGELMQEAGVPRGVVNIVPGNGPTAGQALAEHPLVDKITFTGSTLVGKQLLTAIAPTLKRITLELGGKSPVLVFADADIEKAIPNAAMGIFANTGQICGAGSRLFVEKSVAEDVIDGIREFARALRVGPGDDPASQIGPVISASQQTRVMSYIDSAVADGDLIVTGGTVIDRPGFYVEPTIVRLQRHDTRIAREEVFGPVLTVQTFSNEESVSEIASRANDSVYGLSASVWTKDISRAHRLAKRLRAGEVRINTSFGMDEDMPFGGAKQSGWGKEYGREGIEAYTELKAVTIDVTE